MNPWSLDGMHVVVTGDGRGIDAVIVFTSWKPTARVTG
jgi:hypothetical protein